jgi:hypothetical protein
MSFARARSRFPQGINDRSMAAPPPSVQTKIAFGRAFLIELEKGDTAMATLFAKAFAVQAVQVNGPAGPGAAR